MQTPWVRHWPTKTLFAIINQQVGGQIQNKTFKEVFLPANSKATLCNHQTNVIQRPISLNLYTTNNNIDNGILYI